MNIFAPKTRFGAVCCALSLLVSFIVGCTPKENPEPKPDPKPQDVAVTDVTLSQSTLSLTIGSSASLTAKVSPDNATNKTVTWSSSKSSVATVSNGTVKAVAEGTATIMAKAGGKSATCLVTVTSKEVAVTGITLSPTTLNLNFGETATLTATITPSNATATVTWSTSNIMIASVDNGKVTAEDLGEATITATAGGKSATCKVTVTSQEEPAKKALMKIYNAMDGPNWKMTNRWSLSKPLAEWEGVQWNQWTNALKVFLSRSDLGMKGAFPDCFDELPMLKGFGIQDQPGITGTLPSSFSKLKKLETLIIGGTSMTSLPDIFAEVPLLDASILNNTQMTGPLPESIGKNAVSINIEGNHFTGTVPDSWARLGLGLVIRRENYLSEYIPDSYVRAADASFLINSYLGLAKFRETPMVAGDYDIPAYLPKKDYKDIMTGKSIPFQQIASKNKVTVLLTWATWCPNSAALIPILKKMYDKYHKDGLEIIAAFNTTPEEHRSGNLQQILRDRNMQAWYNFDEFEMSVAEMDCWADGTPCAILVDKNGNVIKDTRWNISDPSRNRFGFSAVNQLIPTLEDYFGPLEEDDHYESKDYSQDGKVITIQKASTGKGINLVFMGDAYTDKDISSGKYEQLMRACAEEFFKIEPYKSFKNRFNVYAVKVVSKHGKTGSGYTTALGTSFTSDGSASGNENKVFEYALKVSGISSKKNLVIGVLVNSIHPGGITTMNETQQSGIGYLSSYTNERSAFGPILRHEVGGHAFAFLGDEYATRNEAPNQATINSMNQLYTSYGWYANLDFTNDTKKVKWADFLSDSRYKNEVGIYEGGNNLRKGVYRPSENSMMRDDLEYFNAPSRHAIYKRIMTLSGESYTFNKFLTYDAVNRGAKPAGAPATHSGEEVVHGAPPVVTR